MKTHDVSNQPPPLVGHDPLESDRALSEALDREGAGWARSEVRAFGLRTTSEEVIRWGFQSNENPPILKTHDRYGHRIDEVEFHPAYHALMKLGVEARVHNYPWHETRQGAHVARAAAYS